MDTLIEDQIRTEFEDCLLGTLKRLKGKDTHRPFHAAMLSEEALFWSRLERSFSTSFGQGFIERVSRLVCQAAGAEQAVIHKESYVALTTVQWETIEKIVREARGDNAVYTPSWERDLARVNEAGAFGEMTPKRRIISDLWWQKGASESFVSIKTVKPNLDQTAEAKRDLLKLAAGHPEANVYFGLYYNPYGDEKSDYSWSPAKRIFDTTHDECFLVGRDYWDTLGGEGTYGSMLDLANEAGMRVRPLLDDAFGNRLSAARTLFVENL